MQTEMRLLLLGLNQMEDLGRQAVQRWLMESGEVT